MGTMNKMRENTGIILWILVFAFGVIWVLQDSGGLDVVGVGGTRNIIVVNGDAIPYEDYARAVDAQVQQYQQQTGETMPPQMLDQQRELVFEQLVNSKLREHEMQRLGIEVTDEEIYNMVMGANPHPIIRTYFGDQDGNVDRALLQNFVNNPDARQDWIQIENYLRAERRNQKLDNLIAATVRVTEQDILEEYRRQNLSVDAEWVGLRYASIPNDSVTVTENDLRSFYRQHREDYARNRTYSVRYVTRSKQPSAADSAAIRSELERLRPRLAEAEDDSTFLLRNASQIPFSDEWFGANDLRDELSAAIFPNPEAGAILGPIFSGGQAHLVKIRDVRPAESEAVRARHILIRAPEENDEARQQIEDIRNRITSGEATFEEMARQFSQDGSSLRGGDLGWFGRGQMVEPFEDAAFGARTGQVVGPVKTQFGYHLIEVTGRAQSEVKITDYALDVRADIGTLNQIQEQLEDLRYFAEEQGDFDGEAARLGLEVLQVQVEEDQQIIPGLGAGRTILNFLERSKQGAISEVIELNDQFIVAYVEGITPEGYRPFEEVRAELEPRAYIEKKKNLLTDRIRRAYEQVGFEGLPGALGTEVQMASGVSYRTTIVAGLGNAPKFVGTVMGLDQGQISPVVAGESAVFVARVTNVDEPPAITETQRQQIRQRLLQTQRAQVRSAWLQSLRDKAKIEDNRARLLQPI